MFAVVFSVRVVEAGLDPFRVTEAGEKLQVAACMVLLQPNEIDWLKPLIGVAVTV